MYIPIVINDQQYTMADVINNRRGTMRESISTLGKSHIEVFDTTEGRTCDGNPHLELTRYQQF